jgi:hypothetical protein
MPPSYQAKLAKHNWGPKKDLDLEKKLGDLKVDLTDEIVRQISDLTYDECEAFVIELFKAQTSQAAATALAAIWSQCTLQTTISQEEDKTTWADRCRTEAQLSH